MTTEQLQVRHNRLVEVVRRMRGCQREWIKHRIGTDKVRMMRYQREVDELLEQERLLKEEELRPKPIKQLEVFNG